MTNEIYLYPQVGLSKYRKQRVNNTRSNHKTKPSLLEKKVFEVIYLISFIKSFFDQKNS
jgi:hypothetical protein